MDDTQVHFDFSLSNKQILKLSLMGYFSCRAQSSVLTSNSHTNSKKTNNNGEEDEQHNPIKFKEFQYSELEAATNGFSNEKLLGKGSHGCVYKGVLPSGRLIAVKKPFRPTSEVDNEIDILSNIQKSPSLVNLVGFTPNGYPKSERLLVVEFMSNGTLYDVLHSCSSPPSWGRRIRLALQTAKAIFTLHSSSPPIIHRDIKSANILIDKKFNARLGDFGLALRWNHIVSTRPPAGTIGYLDPGYITPDNLSTKTDVFSFGILLLEIISGRKAMDLGYSPPSIVDWAVPLIRRGRFLEVFDPRTPLPKDPFVRKDLAVLGAKCVRSCRERRPSMMEVVDCLTTLSKIVMTTSSTNVLTNSCITMIDVVGQQGNASDVSRPARHSRVYSDLGIGNRNNLMTLMAETGADEFEHGSSKVHGDNVRVASGSGGGSERYGFLARTYGRDGGLQLRRNQSARGNPGEFLKQERLSRSYRGAFCIQTETTDSLASRSTVK